MSDDYLWDGGESPGPDESGCRKARADAGPAPHAPCRSTRPESADAVALFACSRPNRYSFFLRYTFGSGRRRWRWPRRSL